MKKLIFLFGLCIILFSCEEEKLPEVTNPRFSVAYIQEVDSTGVVFAANIYDIGKQEVIEYGFYYGRSQLDLLENGEIVKQAGKPDKFFELKANYSLIKDRQYFVAAYIKTSEGITLSEPTNFISQGSTGFIYERIEFPENAYYGDTIRIYAKNLTQNISKYKVKINNQQTTVFNLTTTYFEFTIPDGATFSKSQDVSFEIEVSEKKLTLYIPFNLREPEFLIDENRFLDFSTQFVIKGKYLRTSGVYIEIIGGQYPYFSDNITVTDSTIAFKPMAFFNTNSPRFNVGIRGQNYLVENNFKIKPTIFDPNQVININSVKRKSVILKGNNFNPFEPYLNPLKIEDNSIVYEVISVTENELEVLFYSNEINQNKTINVSIANAGIESENKVQVNFIEPRTPIMDLNNGSVRVFSSIGDKIYYISNNNIVEIDPKSKTNTIKASISGMFYSHDYGDMIIENQGDLYFNLNNYSNNFSDNKFFVYSPTTNSITELPKIPSESLRLLSYFSINNEIYVLASSSEFENNRRVYKNHILKYNISNQNWIRINNINNAKSFIVIPFEYNGETYGISGNYQNPNGTEISKFNPITNQWVILKTFSHMVSFDRFNQGSVIGDKVYFGDGYAGYAIDMKDLSMEIIDIGNQFFHLGTSIGDYYYYPYSYDFGNSSTLFKFDPSL